MKLILKEDPKEWRKAVWLGSMGFAILDSMLRWRNVFSKTTWISILVALVLVDLTAAVFPKLFRGYYRITARFSHLINELVGKVVLSSVFFIIFVPSSLIMRLLGKDSLRLRRSQNAKSYWNDARSKSSLDRSF